ncbi:MAG: manganese efflux pump [Lachnospiraceae bacterium]|nr:manganese efflux pump [Lachnospiraceae bacterium]
MSIWEVLIIAVGLSMDAFAVALCKGLSMKKLSIKYGIIIALFFGVFQALMPLIGWFVSSRFEKYIKAYDHWIAFAILLIIGAKMIIDAIKESRDPEKETEFRFKVTEMLILAVATSIDALAVGVSFGLLEINIWSSISIIGCVTFILSFIGVIIGNFFGNRFRTKAEIAGGIILILLGVKILLEHLGIINF